MKEKIKIFLPEQKVNARIAEVAKKISEDYAGEEVHLICVLKGSVFFTCELAKRITVPVTIDEPLEGKNVLVVEDIIDSGRTLSYLLDILEKRNPKSMRLCTLLDKPDRRVKDVAVDYTCFEIPDEFVVGYGLDYAQKYRNLPFIGVVEFVDE